MRKLLTLFVFPALFLLLYSSNITYAHPGNTDAYGGHTCRTNCPSWGYNYGEYHYHGGGYYEDDYYDQGFEYGRYDALDANHDYITSNARIEGESAGFKDGNAGASEQFYPEAPDWICDLEFDFRSGEYQDYIDGVYDGFIEGCSELANETFSEAYSESYEKGYTQYQNRIKDEEIKLNHELDNSKQDESTSWLWSIGGIAAFYGLFAVIGSWESIKEWFKNL